MSETGFTLPIVEKLRDGDDLHSRIEAAHTIAALYGALEEIIPCIGSPVPLPDAAKRVRRAVAALAQARGQS